MSGSHAEHHAPSGLPVPVADALPRSVSLRIVTMPKDTNHYGTIFGGVILSSIDQAAFVEAKRHGCHRWVTASIDRVDFKAPVGVGDTVSFYTRVVREGRSSLTIFIEVEAERNRTHDTVPVTSATVTMVAVDANGHSIPFRGPPSV